MKINKFYLLLILCLSLSSCSKDDDLPITIPMTEEGNNDNDKEEAVRYYVKYEVSFSTQHINASRLIQFTNENGEQSISLTNQIYNVSWEGVYGPIEKSFETSLNCSTPNYEYSSNIHARIYVCREEEPFVIKAEGNGTHSLSLHYKIDF